MGIIIKGKLIIFNNYHSYIIIKCMLEEITDICEKYLQCITNHWMEITMEVKVNES